MSEGLGWHIPIPEVSLSLEGIAMARTTPRPPPTATQTLPSLLRPCPCCGAPMWATYHHSRPLPTLTAVVHLTLQIRQGLHPPARSFAAPSALRPQGDWSCLNSSIAGRLALMSDGPQDGKGRLRPGCCVARYGSWRARPLASVRSPPRRSRQPTWRPARPCGMP